MRGLLGSRDDQNANLDARPVAVVRARIVSILVIAVAVALLPLGEGRFLVAALLLVVATPAVAIIELYLSARTAERWTPLVDVVCVVAVSSLAPAAWTPALVIGTVSVAYSALAYSRRDFMATFAFMHVALAIVALVHDVPNWELSILASAAVLFPIVSFGAWFVTGTEVAAARNRVLLESATALFFEFDDSTHRLRSITGNVPRIIGYGNDEILDLFPFKIIDERDIASLLDFEALDAGSYETTVRARHADGGLRWFRLVGSRSETESNILVGAVFDVTDLETSKIELRRRAERDALTGLHNRETAMQSLENVIAVQPERAGFLMLDLNGFKQINDTLGHPTGDAVLRVLADRLSSLGCDVECVARLGGDEFGIIVVHDDPSAHALEVADRVAELISERVQVEQLRLALSASIGIATGGPGRTATDVIRDADIAMYQAKRGRLGIQVFEKRLDGPTTDQLILGDELATDLESRLQLFYQPIVSLSDGAVVGVEGLARLRKPDGGVLQPNEFLGAVDLAGLGERFDHEVLRQACEAAASRPVGDCFEVSVNMTAAGLRSVASLETLRGFLASVPMDARQLTIEIGEADIAHNLGDLVPVLSELRNMGVGIALDDFGTGFSSLIRLRDLPFTALKIDRMLLHDLSEGGVNASIVRATIEVARGLGLVTIAEGVEDQATVDVLTAMGCDRAQGYWFAPPMQSLDDAALACADAQLS